MAVNTVLKLTLVTRTISDDLEQLTVKVDTDSTAFCITCVYRPPSGSVQSFIKQTDQLLDEIQQVYSSSSFILVVILMKIFYKDLIIYHHSLAVLDLNNTQGQQQETVALCWITPISRLQDIPLEHLLPTHIIQTMMWFQ